MTHQQKQLIRELVQKYSEHLGTESLLAYIAETNGMPAASKTLIQSLKTGDSLSSDWLFRDCLKYNVVFHLFVNEIRSLVVLLDPGLENEDYFATLGISPGSGKDEIKQECRTMSPQYHPDAASPLHRDRPTQFIEINKAHNVLLTAQVTEEGNEKSTPSKQWQNNRARRFSVSPKKKLYVWASAALVILVIVSTVVLITTKNRVMFAVSQKGHTVSTVSADAVPKSIQSEVVTDRSHEQQRAVEPNGFATPSLSKKPLLAVQEKQTEQIEQIKDIGKIPLKPTSEQLPLEPVTIASNARLPDAQKLPVATKFPDTIDTLGAVAAVVKQPLENKPSAVNHTKAVTDRSHKQQRAFEQTGFATTSPSKKPLLAVQEKQTEQIKDIGKIPLKPTSEQLFPEPVRIADNARLPDAQKLPVVTKYPDIIDTLGVSTTVVKQPLENKPSVVNHTKAVTDPSPEQQRVVEQNGFATPSPSKKPLLAVQEKQTEQIEQIKDIGKIPLKPTSEQLSPEPVTNANNARLPDAQKLPVITKSQDTIDKLEAATTVVKQPLENKPSVINHTKKHLKSKSAPLDNSIQTSVDNFPVEKKQIQADLQSRIDTFLDNYIKAHQQRNLILLSNFFEPDAIENGKPFTSMLPTYKELFETASDISLKVEKTSWQQLEGKIDVRGNFEFSAQYSDSRTFSGTGPIHFVLMDNNNSFRVSVLKYDFVGEN